MFAFFSSDLPFARKESILSGGCEEKFLTVCTSFVHIGYAGRLHWHKLNIAWSWLRHFFIETQCCPWLSDFSRRAAEHIFISLEDSIVNVYLKDESSHHTINLSLAELEAELDPNALFRANRQEIVKISEISGFQSETVRKGILGVISKLTRYNNEYFFLIEVARSLFYSYLCIANGNSKDSKNTQYIIRHW